MFQNLTANERIDLILVKVERAKELISELEKEVRSFLDTKPYVVEVKRDPDTRKLIYFVARVQEPPVRIAAIAGDVIQNLRSTLDHLAYQLICVGTSQTPSDRVYFPIADDARKYHNTRTEKVRGMRQDAINAIDALQPYNGGNNTLWVIHKLNIIDKHRFLLTVGSAYQSVNIGPQLIKEIQSFFLSDPNNTNTIPPIDLFLKPADRLFPLKPGDELFIDAPDAEPIPQMQFVFELAFGEPQILDGKPISETLKEMANHVNDLVVSFTQFLV